MSDIKIYIIDRDQKKYSLIVPTDMNMNLMEACKSYEFPVEGICGGMAMCATCNCLVKSNHPLPEMSEDEEAMLDEAFVLDIDGSRLMCQIPVSDKIDGLQIQLGELTAE